MGTGKKGVKLNHMIGQWTYWDVLIHFQIHFQNYDFLRTHLNNVTRVSIAEHEKNWEFAEQHRQNNAQPRNHFFLALTRAAVVACCCSPHFFLKWKKKNVRFPSYFLKLALQRSPLEAFAFVACCSLWYIPPPPILYVNILHQRRKSGRSRAHVQQRVGGEVNASLMHRSLDTNIDRQQHAGHEDLDLEIRAACCLCYKTAT